MSALWLLTSFSSESPLQHHTFVLQLFKVHLDLLQSPLYGLQSTKKKKKKVIDVHISLWFFVAWWWNLKTDFMS